jgi:hypothetical protein
MARSRKISRMQFALLVVVLFLGAIAASKAHSATCTEGTGMPPFLGEQIIDPNVLLMIDNSASMLDLAAVGSAGICYDGTDETGTESYDSTKDYSGYFRQYLPPPYNVLEDDWYGYNFSDGRFEKITDSGASANCGPDDGTELYYTDGELCMRAKVDKTDPTNWEFEAITAFAARGNFLNWASASKLDIQKKVLTGGKYDSANQDILLESRGCLNHRYVKKFGVVQASDITTKYLSLGITIPADWKNGTVYPPHSVVKYGGTGYYTVGGGTSSGISPLADTGVTWMSRDYVDLTQIEIFKVTDGGFTQGACQDALEEMAGMLSSSPQDITRLGVLMGLIDDCLATDTANTLEQNSNAVFNQSTADCWYLDKFGIDLWKQANQTMSNIIQGCEKVYADIDPRRPVDITSSDTAYACYGINDPSQGYVGRCWDIGVTCDTISCDGTTPLAWNEICDGGIVKYCEEVGGSGKCRKDPTWLIKYDCPVGIGGIPPGWDTDLNTADCVREAMLDYCGYFNTPQVIDPSDQEGSVSGDYYNAPAILIEAAAEAQLDKPVVKMNGRIFSADPASTGILSLNAKKFRFGAMAFNHQGEQTECDSTGNEKLLIDCDNKLDGAQVISYIAKSDPPTQLITAINNTKATAWTPLAEALYNAIGYFGQDPAMRLNPSDFLTQAEIDAPAEVYDPAKEVAGGYAVGAKVTRLGNTYIANPPDPGSSELVWVKLPDTLPVDADPIEAWCQSNNVILISEGASTVDIAPEVVSFVTATSDGDTDSGDCGRFSGSSYLDDLTWYGWQGDMWSNNPDPDKEKYSDIRSWVVESAERQLTGLTGECEPAALLESAAINGGTNSKYKAAGGEVTFRTELQRAFSTILDRVSSGSAASIISASRSGEGALYQAIFWPDKDSGRIDAATGDKIMVKWTGEVHAFLVDKYGFLYMDDCKDDTAGCHTGGLDEPYDSNYDGVLDGFRDTPVVAYFDEVGQTDTSGSSAKTTKICPATLEGGQIVFFDAVSGACRKMPIALEQTEYLWSTTDWFNRDDVDINLPYNRTLDADNKFNFTTSGNPDRRFIFTWNDLNNDGVVDDDEMRDFEPGLPAMGSTTSGSLPTVSVATRGPVPLDFSVDPTAADAEDQVNNIIKWIRGEEVSGMRQRLVKFDNNGNDTIDVDEYAVWKVGDVIHSTPISVSAPAEFYHQLYRDNSYAEFSDRWQNRRHMIYFGANDGMLRAVNGGFYDEENNWFCRAQDCGSTTNTPELGAEMWAYVPYNLLPHLGCLTDPDYGTIPTEHKYFVDLRPRIFDVQIFKEESVCTSGGYNDPGCIHPKGWGTILVGGMRFGGSKVRPSDYDDDGVQEYPADNREFTSAYFVFDITDPERVPTLLGEFTKTIDTTIVSDLDGDGAPDHSPEVELGYTTVISTVVPMKRKDEALSGEDTDCDGDNSNDPEISMWYLILGSGPTELDGTSSRHGSISVVPLHRFIDSYPADSNDPKRSMRIPAALPATTFDATGHPWNLPPSADYGYPVDERGGRGFGTFTLPDENSFVSDAITVDIEVESDYLADVVYFGTVSGGWDAAHDGICSDSWGGKMYRLVTRKELATDSSVQCLAEPSEWDLALLLDAGRPIVSPATVGTDGTDFWVYFGTGRFFDKLDKTDDCSNDTQRFYGIREPIDFGDNCKSLSWAEVTNVDPPFVQNPILYEPAQITGVDLTTTPKTVLTDPGGIARGELGLLPVGDIRILATTSQVEPDTLICNGDAGTLINDNGTPDPADDIYEYTDTSCLPKTVLPTATIPYPGTRSFNDLINTISGTSFRCGVGTVGTDGWYRDIPDDRERNLGQATLLGGLLSYTTYTPYADPCLSEGLGYLYGIYYRTGTAWTEDVFGTVNVAGRPRKENPERMYLGKGLSTTPNIHVGKGKGGKAFIQTSVGQIVEIPQPNLPNKHIKSGRVKWRDIE